ncbi:hypothetical protein J2S19_000016 [Metabacillus malikii]|uniref:Uncharacterized protein n=1 Tax=Metabacillus malikii TaxID=1504265 RepID=A0ABT9Z940_9BACI|nr:hypothetical protein [Metabacillus malikii]
MVLWNNVSIKEIEIAEEGFVWWPLYLSTKRKILSGGF